MSDTIPDHVKSFTFTHASTATAYHFKTASGWAICTINDATHELNVQSDWGNWSYRWSGFGMPKRGDTEARITLTEFIADRQRWTHYLADKLWGDGYGGRVFDAEESVVALRKLLCEARLEQGRLHTYNPTSDYMWRKKPYWPHDTGLDGEPLTAGIAREIWDALDDLKDCRNDDHFVEKVFQIKGYTWMTEEPWSHTATVRDHKYEVLLFGILPALIAECVKRTEPAPVVDVPVAASV